MDIQYKGNTFIFVINIIFPKNKKKRIVDRSVDFQPCKSLMSYQKLIYIKGVLIILKYCAGIKAFLRHLKYRHLLYKW